ncbi:hypothetical protein M0813_00362 [Anaeramoeba flamelloides]|uniref:Uncharacterized protein n=1 Tax=Anaeramoeba flamelloides TaxID=1746091 RepID=A0ABQ8YA20_9EUKA|nr:hypothetical protein M0813_00362 [Anaeramoeba flamelloides]
MFLIPRTKKIQSLKYNPHNLVGNKKSGKSKGNKQKEALTFMKKIFQNINLTEEEAFSPDCSHLLNLINILFPCEFNQIITTKNKEKIQEHNLNEYLSQLTSLNYRVKNFPKEEYYQSNKVGIKKIVSTIFHLKSEYEQNGIQRNEKENDLRIFYVQKKSNKKLKSQEIYGINPFLTNQKTTNTFQTTGTVRTKNIFYLKEKNQLALLKKRSKQLGYPLMKNTWSGHGSESESESKSENAIESSTYSTNTDSEFAKRSKKKKKKKKNLNDQKGWDEVDLNQIFVDEIKDDSNNDVNSSTEEEWSNQTFSDSTDSGSNNLSSNNQNRKNKKKKKHNDYWPSFEVDSKKKVSTTSKTKSKMNQNKNKTKDNPNSSDSSNFDSKFNINNSKANQQKKKKKNRGENDSNRSKNKKHKSDLNKNRSKQQQQKTSKNRGKGQANNKKKILVNREKEYPKIPLQISKHNHFLKKDLINLFKTSSRRDSKNSKIKRNPKTDGYLHLIFYIINTLDKWRSNDPNFSKKFSRKHGYPNLYKICTQAYKDAINLGIRGSALFEVKISKNFSSKYSSGLLELSTKDLILTLNSENKKPIFKQKFKQYQIQISIEKNSLKEITVNHILLFNTTFSIRFYSQIDAILAIMTLGHFFKASNLPKKSKKRLGHNPIIVPKRDALQNMDYVQNGNDLVKISELIIPPLVAPNKKFLKKLNSIDRVNLKKNLEKILDEFYQNDGVNFLCAILTNQKYPLISSFIKIRKSKLMIGIEKKTAYKIPFSAKPKIEKNDNQKTIFSLEWTQKATCSATTQPSIRIVCTRVSERSLITNSIEYFIKKWNEFNN